MTFETLNLNIQTPEDDHNTDPEFIRLRGELMALKQPLLDAIANKDLPNAEELHKQALEAKAKLEAYKESLNKKEEYKTIEINGEKLELGPSLGKMTWNEIPAKLEEFNKTLQPGEKPWRVPTKEEFDEIGIPIIETRNNISLSIEQRLEKTHKYVESLGFGSGFAYWSGSEYDAFESNAYGWNSGNGFTSGNNSKNNRYLVRTIR